MTATGRRAASLALLLAAALAAAPAPAQGPGEREVVVLEPRAGVTLRYLALAPQQPPRAAVILLIGGPGILGIPDRPGPDWQREGNFLSRSRELFRGQRLFVALLDAPSDRRTPSVGLDGYRLTVDHARDVAAVIADVRRRAPGAPVWLVGNSLGTLSVVNAAARLAAPEGPDGIVVTSGTMRAPNVARPRPGQLDTVGDARLGAIAVPVLIVAHRDDACRFTPAADAPGLSERFSAAPARKVLVFAGGDAPRSDPCEALAAHGYLGIEREVVAAIAAWLVAPLP